MFLVSFISCTGFLFFFSGCFEKLPCIAPFFMSFCHHIFFCISFLHICFVFWLFWKKSALYASVCISIFFFIFLLSLHLGLFFTFFFVVIFVSFFTFLFFFFCCFEKLPCMHGFAYLVHPPRWDDRQISYIFVYLIRNRKMHFFSKYDFANRLNYPSSCLKCHSPIYLRINKNSRLQKKLLKKRISMNIYHHFFFDSFFLKQNFKIVFKSQKSFRTLGIINNCFFPPE